MPKPKPSFTSGLDSPAASQGDYDAEAVYGLPIFGESALAAIRSGEIRVGALLWKPTGLQVDGQITEADWRETGRLLKMLDSSLQWLIGDFIVCGEALQWGQQKEIAEAFGFEYSTVRDYVYVCSNVDLLVRTDKLDFAHHKLVAAFTPAEQADWLQKASTGDKGKRWSVSRLRAEIEAYYSFALEVPNPPIINTWNQAEAKQREAIRKRFIKANPTTKRGIIDFAKSQSRYWQTFAQELEAEE